MVLLEFDLEMMQPRSSTSTSTILPSPGDFDYVTERVRTIDRLRQFRKQEALQRKIKADREYQVVLFIIFYRNTVTYLLCHHHCPGHPYCT